MGCRGRDFTGQCQTCEAVQGIDSTHMSQHQKNDANVSMKILLLKILGSRCSGTSELNVINESYSGLKNAPSAAISLVLFGLMFHHSSRSGVRSTNVSTASSICDVSPARGLSCQPNSGRPGFPGDSACPSSPVAAFRASRPSAGYE